MLAANLTLMIRYKEWVKKTRMDLSAKMDEEKELSNKGSLRRKIVKKGTLTFFLLRKFDF